MKALPVVETDKLVQSSLVTFSMFLLCVNFKKLITRTFYFLDFTIKQTHGIIIVTMVQVSSHNKMQNTINCITR